MEMRHSRKSRIFSPRIVAVSSLNAVGATLLPSPWNVTAKSLRFNVSDVHILDDAQPNATVTLPHHSNQADAAARRLVDGSVCKSSVATEYCCVESKIPHLTLKRIDPFNSEGTPDLRLVVFALDHDANRAAVYLTFNEHVHVAAPVGSGDPQAVRDLCALVERLGNKRYDLLERGTRVDTFGAPLRRCRVPSAP